MDAMKTCSAPDSAVRQFRKHPVRVLAAAAFVALALAANSARLQPDNARRGAQPHDQPHAAGSFEAPKDARAVEFDVTELIELVQEENKKGGFSSELSLVYVGGQTIHDQSLFRRWRHWLQDAWQNLIQPPQMFP